MNTIIIIATLAAGILVLERYAPNIQLPQVQGWYWRCMLLNSIQAIAALLGACTWDRWLLNVKTISLGDWPFTAQILLGYLTITFIYYWWHRARHSHPTLWRWLHQTHHSASRLEVITSFYKHPFEVMINGVLSSFILHSLLGLSAQASATVILATGIAELFYHMNLKTPHWLGYFFQRPEMHRIHHQRGVHRCNYSDLPCWDLLFGTYANPKKIDVMVGFPDQGEKNLKALLCGKKVRI